MIVAVHQPNHLPWLGYFAKMARADIFVFLDDVQYSKGSYVNRVQVAGAAEPAWLTAPVSFAFGDLISTVTMARNDWTSSHRDRLLQLYRPATSFRDVWPEIERWLQEAPKENLAAANIFLIEKIALRLGLAARCVVSSTLGIPAGPADVRLAEMTRHLAPGGSYLSGSGGANYQSEDVFIDRNVKLAYSDFKPTPYDRGENAFVPGLSILDVVFHTGWDCTRRMVAPHA